MRSREDTSTGEKTGRANAYFLVDPTCCCTRSRISSFNRSPCGAATPLVLSESGSTRIPRPKTSAFSYTREVPVLRGPLVVCVWHDHGELGHMQPRKLMENCEEK